MHHYLLFPSQLSLKFISLLLRPRSRLTLEFRVSIEIPRHNGTAIRRAIFGAAVGATAVFSDTQLQCEILVK
jgi:hypothetical protein